MSLSYYFLPEKISSQKKDLRRANEYWDMVKKFVVDPQDASNIYAFL
jgi:hypothetical protein